MKDRLQSAYFLILAVLLIYKPIHSQSSDNQPEAQSLFDNENYSELIEYIQTLDSIPDSLRYLGGLGAYNLGNFALAKEYFHALETDSIYTDEAVMNLAKIYEFEQNTARALKYYRQLVKLRPEVGSYWRTYGNLCKNTGWYTEAVPAYNKALEINEHDIQSTYGLIEVWLDRDSIYQADSLIEAALLPNQLNPRSLNYGARIAYKLGKYDLTIERLKLHEQLTDLNYQQQKLLGQSYLYLDSTDLCIRYLRISVLSDPNPEFTYYNLGMAYYKQQEWKRADEYLLLSVKHSISPNIDEYLRTKAIVNQTLNKKKVALDDYQMCHDLTNNLNCLFYLAKLSEEYYADKSIALRHYQKYLKSEAPADSYREYAQHRADIIGERIHFEKSKSAK